MAKKKYGMDIIDGGNKSKKLKDLKDDKSKLKKDKLETSQLEDKDIIEIGENCTGDENCDCFVCGLIEELTDVFSKAAETEEKNLREVIKDAINTGFSVGYENCLIDNIEIKEKMLEGMFGDCDFDGSGGSNGNGLN